MRRNNSGSPRRRPSPGLSHDGRSSRRAEDAISGLRVAFNRARRQRGYSAPVVLVCPSLLDGQDVGAGLEQMGGEAVSRRMGADALLQARGPHRRLADLLDGARGDGPIGAAAREEEVGRSDGPPVAAEHGQEPGRASRSFCPSWRMRRTMPAAVDVRGAEATTSEPQPRRPAVAGMARCSRSETAAKDWATSSGLRTTGELPGDLGDDPVVARGRRSVTRCAEGRRAGRLWLE